MITIKTLLSILRICVLLATFVLYNYKTRSKTSAKRTKKETLIKKPFVKSFDEKIVKSMNFKDYAGQSL